MARGRAERVMARRLSAAGAAVEPVGLVVEEPLEIHLDDELVATTSRTPGHDFELAVGHCHGRALLEGRAVHEVRYCGTGSAVETGFNVVSVGTSTAAAPVGPPPPRGLVPEVVVAAAAAGAVGAVAFDAVSGEHVVARTDVRQEHAVDKVVGRLLLDGRLPASDLCLLVAGDVRADVADGAARAGFAAVITTGPPSSAAVRAARSSSLVLAWLRPDHDLVLLAPDPLRTS